MTTLYVNHALGDYFRDINGRLTTFKDEDSVEPYTLDWSETLGDDEIATSTWVVDSGSVATASPSSTTTRATVTVSNTNGVLRNTIVTTGGLTYVKRIAFKAKEL